MAERVISSALSGDVIDLLIKRGMTASTIAELIGVSKSFISRIRSRSRSLTIDHLVALEAAVGEPLPLLLLEATPLKSVPPELRPLYKSTRQVLSTAPRVRKRVSHPRRKVA
jgi:transcriptional regulator with XRE-family HTH domain